MGNRQTNCEERRAAGSDLPEARVSSSSSGDSITSDLRSIHIGEGFETDTNLFRGQILINDTVNYSYGGFAGNATQEAVQADNTAVLALKFENLEEEWETDFSSFTPSEETADDQSRLVSPCAGQSAPFRIAVNSTTAESSTAPQTTSSDVLSSTAALTPPSSLSSSDTWFGLPSLIETSRKSQLEEFAKPSTVDEIWIAKAHEYFDNEETYKHKPKKPTSGRRLRIGPTQKKSWTGMVREMSLRHPLPVNPAPFPISKAMDDLKLRPEKRFVMRNAK
ncbi:unnamed protein product [Cylicocyclus nassatus]|uniref:Uncharacterized protein n=1 Tax=Cylicocyclus nassatus TaxID=53992 RepID=A0AA36DRX0_CYLNA|nr:unnamed protein product [Cylicocyclus nassatus]